MSTDQSLIKTLHKLATEFKGKVKDIDNTAQDIEGEVNDVFEFLLDADRKAKMKKGIDGFIDEIDLDDLFTQVDLRAQMEQVVLEIKHALGKFNLTLDDFPPDTSAILSAIPDLIPDDLTANFPNLKSQIRELTDMISTEDLHIRFKKVDQPVLKKWPATPASATVAISGAEPDPASGEAFEQFLSGIMKDKEDYFNGVLERIEDKIIGSGIFLGIDEKIEPLFKNFTSEAFSVSTFLTEIVSLVKDLTANILDLIRELIDILFEEMEAVLTMFRNALNTAPNALIEQVLRTLIPAEQIPATRKLTVMTLPALALSTPFTLFSQQINSPGISQGSYGSAENIFNSGTGYGSAQLFKGGLAFVGMGISATKIAKGSKISESTEKNLDRLSSVLSVLDILTNISAQLVSSGSAIDSLEKAKTEGDHERANLVIWSYQWLSAVLWPIIAFGMGFKAKGNKENEERTERIVAVSTIVIEVIHLGMFVYINITADKLDQRNKIANVIDPFPGIYGSLISLIMGIRKQGILSIEEKIERLQSSVEAVEEILGDGDANSATPNLSKTYTTLETSKPAIQKYLDNTLRAAIEGIRALYENPLFNSPEFKNSSWDPESVREKTIDAVKAVNIVLYQNILVVRQDKPWEPRLGELLTGIGELQSNLGTKAFEKIQGNTSIKAILPFFEGEKRRVDGILIMNRPLLRLRVKLDQIKIPENTDGATPEIKKLYADFLAARNILRDVWKVSSRNADLEKAYKLISDLNKLNEGLSKINKKSKKLTKQDKNNAKIDKEIRFIDLGKNALTFVLQVAYGALILDELPAAIYEFSEPTEGTSYRTGEEITILILVKPAWITPVVKITAPGQSVVEAGKKGGGWPHERVYTYKIKAGDGLASITLEDDGAKINDPRAHVSFLVNNPQDTVFPNNKTIASGGQITITALADANNTEIEIWFAPEGTTEFDEDKRNMSRGTGKVTELKTIKAPKNKGVYKLFVKDAIGFISPESTATLTVN